MPGALGRREDGERGVGRQAGPGGAGPGPGSAAAWAPVSHAASPELMPGTAGGSLLALTQ